MTSRKEIAMKNFEKGYNCAQAVVLAFEDMLSIDKNTLAMLSSSFGGGMGRLREVCGTVTGMFMVAGMLYGYDGSEGNTAKSAHYARIRELADKFKEQNGSIICRELLGISDTKMPNGQVKAKKAPCKELVGMATEIMEEYIKNNPIEKK